MRHPTSLASIALAISICSQQAAALGTREIYKFAEPSVVVVLAADAKGEKNNLGSGVIISPTEIVTSCKVIEAAADIVITQGSALSKATVRFKDVERDLCQLHIDSPLPSGVPAAMPATATEAEAGQELYAIGSPRGMERSINRTMVSAMRDVPGSKIKLIQIDALLPGGMAGGGVFDQDAKLVGIIVTQFRQVENASYAAPSAWIADLSQRGRDVPLAAAASPAAPDAGVAAGNASPSADTPPPGMPRAGDRWKYRLVDGKKNAGTVVVEIVEARGKLVTERITMEDQKGFLTERKVVAEFNPVKFQDVVTLPGGYQFAEIAPYVPLGLDIKAGQRWQGLPVVAMLPWYGKKKFMTDARVAGREKVRVPAGVFDTTRVQATGEENFGTSIVKINLNYWYSVDSMRTVKMSLEIKSSLSNQQSAETYELVTFEPAK